MPSKNWTLHPPLTPAEREPKFSRFPCWQQRSQFVEQCGEPLTVRRFVLEGEAQVTDSAFKVDMGAQQKDHGDEKARTQEIRSEALRRRASAYKFS